MIRQMEISFETVSGGNKPPAGKSGAFQRDAAPLLLIYQRTMVLQAVAVGIERRQLRAIGKIRIFYQNRIAAQHFFYQIQAIIHNFKTVHPVVGHITVPIVGISIIRSPVRQRRKLIAGVPIGKCMEQLPRLRPVQGPNIAIAVI